jgi:hypothetical protein
MWPVIVKHHYRDKDPHDGDKPLDPTVARVLNTIFIILVLIGGTRLLLKILIKVLISK